MTKKQKKVFWRIIVAAVLVVVVSLIPVKGAARFFLFGIPYLIIGYDILKKAALGIWHKQVFDECFLMAIATVGAFALGEYREGTAVMLFYQIGELFQSYAVGKSRKNITALMDIRPDFANLLVDGEEKEVDPDEVEVGSLILVKPGEKIPLDGIVREGRATVNTSALTGESLPREIETGDEVISGCVNMSGVLTIETTREFEESTVSKILELVENSSMKKSRSENFITRFARYYTPAVCFLALAVALLPPIVQLAMGMSPLWAKWVIRALTMLVISCPCALVISIPLSFFGGIGGASAQGILVKGSNYLEILSKTKYVLCDKTGTLTKGAFEVTAMHPADGVSEGELLETAAVCECFSNHPISRSLKAAYGKEIDQERLSDVEEIGGHGVTAKVDGIPAAVGNEKLMKKLGMTFFSTEEVGTQIHVVKDGKYLGLLMIADVVKEGAKEAVAELKRNGVKKVIMLTGDSKKAADAVATQLNVDEVRSELLPSDKVDSVEAILALKNRGECVAFVGDGMNDAPVLSRADIGIAMGAMGSDAAIEAADVVLMDDDPGKIATAMAISRKTLGIVRQNIVFSLVIKFACLGLGAIGYVNMWWAIFADVGVMVLAVLNATRALVYKRG
ncbi:Cd2+/Zn2+-exporting ATPase [Lachnospiraceae bacterium XBB1006]|nr:Cd2+/Zn2+-exporting ATPase [Lachnospiraceae bacterium XBB1006]